MNSNTTEQSFFNIAVSALQTVITNYPTYNLFTQQQDYLRHELVKSSNNPLLKFGRKYFSQNDEDGILLEILGRTGILDKQNKNFIEFGVGNGTENNTLILLMNDFQGVWIGNEDLVIDTSTSKRLSYIKNWVTLENIDSLYGQAINFLNSNEIDVFSMDLDGNDLHFINSIIKSYSQPNIIIAEYNGKFPPPIKFNINYDENHNFNSDYMGASLQSLVDALEDNYILVACNVAGCNSFFVHKKFQSAFHDIPKKISEIFMPANYGIVTRVGHGVSPKTIEHFI